MINKKYIAVFLIFILGIYCWYDYRKTQTQSAAESLSVSAIRFHILANSDSYADQKLKMQVKENVINYIYDNTGDFKTVDEAKEFILDNDKQIKKIASDTILSNGCHYNVHSVFGTDSFPEKSYGDIVFPKGDYTSYTLSIGKGKGHNWWCVLYPPLCFVDASTGIVPDNSKEKLHESLTEQEYHTVVKYRFKYLTFFNKFLPE